MHSCDTQSGLIPYETALNYILENTNVSCSEESVSLLDACNRVLAQTVTANVAVPPEDNSAMDGYALNSEDLRSQNYFLPISQRIPAGTSPKRLSQGSCARIYTGAEIPAGADTVVMQENVSERGEIIQFPRETKANQNIRRKGQDIKFNETVLHSGKRLNPVDIGILASVGVSFVDVYKPLKVAILSTGNELVEPGQALGAGKIFNSNRYMLNSLLLQYGIEVIDLGCVEDSKASLEQILRNTAPQVDLIITTGGVSVGDKDFVRSSVELLGSLDIWKIGIKPGKPVALGKVGDTTFIGLPGNPASTLITFNFIALPLINSLQGEKYIPPLQISVKAGFERLKTSNRQEYLRLEWKMG